MMSLQLKWSPLLFSNSHKGIKLYHLIEYLKDSMWLVLCGCTGRYMFCLFVSFLQQFCWCYSSAYVVDLCTGTIGVKINFQFVFPTTVVAW